MKRGSIQNQMLVWMLALALIPLTLVSGLSYLVANKSLTQASVEKLEDTASEKIKFIYNWFDYRFMDLQKQAEDRANVSFISELVESYRSSGMPLDQYVQTYEYSLIETKNKQPLADLILTYDYIYDLFLIDTEGNVLFTIVKEDDFGTNLISGKYSNTMFSRSIRKTLKTGASSFSDFERYAPSNNELAGFLTAPLMDANGEILGAFAIQFRIDRITKLLLDDTSSRLHHYLVGSDGTLRSAYTNEEEILRRKIDTEQYRLWIEEHLGVSGDKYGHHDQEEAFTYLNPDNVSVIGLHQNIDVFDIEWVLISEVEESEALESAYYLAALVLALLGVTLIVVVIMTLQFAKRFSDPIMSLSELSEKAATGNVDDRSDVSENNELGVLADSFNKMLDARKIYEQQLEENAHQLELVMQSTGSGVWDWQVQTGEVKFNDRWAEIIGYTLEELEPIDINTWASACHPEDLKRSNLLLEKHWQGDTDHYTSEARMKHKQGHWVWVLDTGKVVEWHADGKPKRMIGTHIDITERKQVETEILKAKDAAELAAKTKSEFLASMSHEIRTPMNGVLGMLGLLSRSPLNADQQHQTRLALSSAESLLSLINDILDFSKVEAGKLDLEIMDFNLSSMLGDFAESMAQRAEEAGLEFVLDVTGINHTMVQGDPSRIRQVLTNLVGNAIKFTSQGEIIVEAKLVDESETHTRLHCAIKDTGIGIAQDKLAHIFESFRQVDASTTRKYGGTGLGLSIVKQLCVLMDGDVSVTSELNKGSCFSFDVLLERSSLSQQIIPNVDVNGVNILIVDDNRTNLDVLRRQLEMWGAVVTEAMSGQQALKILDARVEAGKEPFKVAFYDMQMPEMDGAMLAEKTRGRKALDDMKLVMMTSISTRGDAAYFANLGFSAYFRKPTTTSDLFDALAVVICGGEVLEQAQPLVTQHYLRGLDHSDVVDPSLRVVVNTLSERILLVEDNAINQTVAKGILEELGLHCDVAGNGMEALQTMKEQLSIDPYNLILMDCQMPEMDGYEATQRIRAGEAGDAYKEIPIVAMTANAMKGDKERCLQVGMSDYLSKPVDPDALETAIRKWTNKASPVETESTRPPEKKTENEGDSKELLRWDIAAALKRVRNKTERLMMLIDMFLADMPGRVDDLSELIAQDEFEKAEKLAHTCKGVAGNLGAEILMSAAFDMEQAGRNGDMVGLRNGYEEFKQELELVTPLLREYSDKSES